MMMMMTVMDWSKGGWIESMVDEELSLLFSDKKHPSCHEVYEG